MKHPQFIALEGGEGSGKSSVLKAIKAKYGERIITTREPGGSVYAEAIRELALKHPNAKDATPLTQLLLMSAARADHIKHTIAPALQKGLSVISDRFMASSYAYQLVAQDHLELEDLFWEIADVLTVQPDVYIYLDVNPETGLKRARSRNAVEGDGNHFDDKDVAFHRILQQGYGRFFQYSFSVNSMVIEIDANQPQEKVVQDVLDVLENM